MFSIIVVPPPTTEDERNRTPTTRAPGERRAYGLFACGAFRVPGRGDRAGATR
ncbi:hypothetical protein [Streptomyces sp. SID5643]|uniref:hypothetical protein n=1 Tax=Streptomyces sp. SID5643 TaxID=2690307 RepID=UPI0013696900|nr:hypothetical protein [Streptomyces sp. SID5643]